MGMAIEQSLRQAYSAREHKEEETIYIHISSCLLYTSANRRMVGCLFCPLHLDLGCHMIFGVSRNPPAHPGPINFEAEKTISIPQYYVLPCCVMGILTLSTNHQKYVQEILDGIDQRQVGHLVQACVITIQTS